MSLSSRTYDNPATKRVALLYGCNPRTQSRYSGLSCAHLEIQIMREADAAQDSTPKGYRWTDWSSGKPTSYYVDGLTISCQFDLKSTPENDDLFLYGFHTRFMDKSYIDLEVASEMTRTLKRAKTAEEGLDAISGQAVEFARYAHAILGKLGVEDVVRYTSDTHRGDLGRDENFVHVPNFRELYKSIDKLTRDIIAS